MSFDEVALVARRQLDRVGGGALCVYHRGEPVLDIWQGAIDRAGERRWEHDTMAMAWSTTKGVASTALHLLADRGLLAYDDPVARHWPEYGVNGKERSTVRQVLSMEAGLYDIRHLVDDPRQMLDHETMAAALAAAAPAHVPGVRNGYHALTYGWLIAELVRRVTGTSLGTFVQRELAEPLGLDGCYIGTPAAQIQRVAARPNLAPERRWVRRAAKIADPFASALGVSPTRVAAAFAPRHASSLFASDELLKAEVPSMNGVFTARSLARLYAALGSDDGLDGVKLWSPDTRRMVALQQNDRRDQVLAIRGRWWLGYHRPFPPKRASSTAFGFYGAYGSGAYADPARSVAVGLVVPRGTGLPLTRLVGPIAEACDAA